MCSVTCYWLKLGGTFKLVWPPVGPIWAPYPIFLDLKISKFPAWGTRQKIQISHMCHSTARDNSVFFEPHVSFFPARILCFSWQSYFSGLRSGFPLKSSYGCFQFHAIWLTLCQDYEPGRPRNWNFGSFFSGTKSGPTSQASVHRITSQAVDSIAKFSGNSGIESRFCLVPEPVWP